jgi:hypothetical protein
MSGVDTQPYESQQELVTYCQGERVSSTRSTLTLVLGAHFEVAFLLCLCIEREHLIEKGDKLREFETRDCHKHSWIALQVGISQYHAGSLPYSGSIVNVI